MKGKQQNLYSVPNLDRALAIIEYLAGKSEGYNITGIAEQLGFPKNSVYRIVKTLLMHGYLSQTEKIYTVTTKLLALGYAALGKINILEIAIEIMRDLRDESKETVLIGTLVGNKGVVLEQVPSSYEIKFTIDVGHIFLPHTAAPGKAILAYLPQQERDRILNEMEYTRYNSKTITNPKSMMECLADVQLRGYAVDSAERIESLHGVASPVFNHWGYPIAAIWITGPAFRMPECDFGELGEIVKKHAYRVSSRLGWNPGPQKMSAG